MILTMKTTSAVEYLHEATQDPEQEICTLMKDASVLAQVLRQRRFIAWHKNEERGYGPEFPLPEYRREISGTLLTHRLTRGWTRADIEPTLAEKCAHMDVRYSYPEILDAIEEHRRAGFVRLTIPEERQRHIANLTDINASMALLVPIEAYIQILETCRAVLRRWSQNLLRMGVRGQGMKFTAEERATARSVDALLERCQIESGTEAWQNTVRATQPPNLIGRLFRIA